MGFCATSLFFQSVVYGVKNLFFNGPSVISHGIPKHFSCSFNLTMF
jgi:hypothetical protein